MEFDCCLCIMFYLDVIMITFHKLTSNENETTNRENAIPTEAKKDRDRDTIGCHGKWADSIVERYG